MRTPARSPLLIFLLPIVVSLAVCLGVLGAMLPVGVQAQEAPPWPGPPLPPPTPIEPPIVFSPQVVVERHAVDAVIDGTLRRSGDRLRLTSPS